MAQRFEAPGWREYKMDFKKPFLAIEPAEEEEAGVATALDALVKNGILPHADFPADGLAATRTAMETEFEIPWTAITPRLHRLIYAINAIHQPKTMIAVGVFCGFTFFANAGAGSGPGKCYEADQLVGIEIDPDEAERAERNVRAVDPSGVAKVLATDGVKWLEEFEGTIDLLYLDATAPGDEGKSLYLRVLQAAWHAMPKGSLILAHNSVNAADDLEGYLNFVRDPANCRESVNVVLDTMGLEVSQR